MRIKNIFFVLAISLLAACSGAKVLNEGLSESAQSRFDYYFYEALRLKENGEHDKAIETLLLCEAINPEDAALQAELGIEYLQFGIVDEALKRMEKAVALSPSNWWYSVRLITLYSQQKKYDKALELAKSVQQIFPYKQDIYTLQASLYKQTGDLNGAIEAYDQLEKISGNSEWISMEKFRLHYASDQKEKAIQEIDKLIDKYPGETRHQVFKGDIYLEMNELEKAFEIYQKVLEEDPKSPYVYISLSEYYQKIGDAEKSIESIVNSLKNENLEVETKLEILGQYAGTLTESDDKFSETEELFKMLIDRYPLEEMVHAYYATFLLIKERYDEAAEELETMIDINPENEQAWIQLIQIFVQEQDFENVNKLMDRAIEKFPEAPIYYFYKAISLFQLGEYENSIETNEKAIALLTPEQFQLKSDFLAQIADAHYKLKNQEKAFEYYEEALKINPHNVLVLNNYAYYLSLEDKNLSKAERMSAKTIEIEPNNSTYLDTYAWILYKQKSFSLAKFYIERAVDNLPDDYDRGVVLDHYGDILFMNGMVDKAVETWEKALESVGESDLNIDLVKEKIKNRGWINN